ncbi:hypothetical protein HK097_006216 [Rhizophlyctis rosea]|uniref:Uncharacterized protein n=1 Tax=Rhizophlyctis rosea TaxID=64517 RepID=A0AAD5S143_9FUNG|nr:hypothetical protein HK097_006216 [Rhizophlyctis rosea]
MTDPGPNYKWHRDNKGRLSMDLKEFQRYQKDMKDRGEKPKFEIGEYYLREVTSPAADKKSSTAGKTPHTNQ